MSLLMNACAAADTSSTGSKPFSEVGTVITASAAVEAENSSAAHGDSSTSKENRGEEHEEDDDEEEDQRNNQYGSFVVSPILPLKEQLEKDKDDESLRRWKEQLLGSIVLDAVEEGIEPKLQVINFTILSSGRPDIVVPLPLPSDCRPHLFTLKEGSTYNIKFTFKVQCNIVSGLTYIHTVWKNGFKVDKKKVMLGTFGPQDEPYSYVMEEEVTPSGIFARGSYTSRIRVRIERAWQFPLDYISETHVTCFLEKNETHVTCISFNWMQLVDDDGRVHLEIQHTFNIHKDW